MSIITPKPWGTEEIWATNHHSVGKLLTIEGGHRLSRKYHKRKNHQIRILTGSLIVEVGPLSEGADIESVTLVAGDTFYLPARTIHRFCASPDGAVVLELSNSGAEDSVRLEDDYRRVTDIPSRGPQSEK